MLARRAERPPCAPLPHFRSRGCEFGTHCTEYVCMYSVLRGLQSKSACNHTQHPPASKIFFFSESPWRRVPDFQDWLRYSWGPPDAPADRATSSSPVFFSVFFFFFIKGQVNEKTPGGLKLSLHAVKAPCRGPKETKHPPAAYHDHVFARPYKCRQLHHRSSPSSPVSCLGP